MAVVVTDDVRVLSTFTVDTNVVVRVRSTVCVFTYSFLLVTVDTVTNVLGEVTVSVVR